MTTKQIKIRVRNLIKDINLPIQSNLLEVVLAREISETTEDFYKNREKISEYLKESYFISKEGIVMRKN